MLEDEFIKRYNDLVYKSLEKFCGITKDNITDYLGSIKTEYKDGDKKYYLDGEEVFTIRTITKEDGEVLDIEVAPTLR